VVISVDHKSWAVETVYDISKRYNGDNMLVSDRNRVVFVHIQKTAGSSLRSSLCKNDSDVWELGGKHAGIGEVRLPEGYNIISFVRNPWERLVSWYEMIQEKGRNRDISNIKSRFYRAVLQARSFDDFVSNTEPVTENGSIKSVFRPQCDYLKRDGKMKATFVGRYETLTEDIARLEDWLGITISLPHIKQSPEYGAWRKYYTKETRNFVEACFREDIFRFGYTFNG